MLILVAGLLIFFGVHSLPMMRGFRALLHGRLGENGYKGLYTFLSLAGFVLIIYGYSEARLEDVPVLYDPPAWTRHLVMLLMLPFFVLLISAYVPGRVKKTVKHPILVAAKLWAFAHLLVRGDLVSVLLFGSFLAWAVVDRISIKRRTRAAGAVQEGGTVSVNVSNELLYVLLGLAIYGWMIWQGHGLVIGYPLT